MSGLAAGLVSALSALSFGAILFGPLGAIQHGVVVALTGALAGVLVAWLGGRPVVLAQVQPVIVVILALGIADLSRRMGPEAEPATVVATATAMVAASGIATGAVLWAVGALRLGRLSRAIPYPVLGGFLAATGILLIDGAVVLGNGGVRPGLAVPDMAALVGWVGPVLAGAVLAIAARWIGTFGTLVGGFVLVAVAFWVAGAAGFVDAGNEAFYLDGSIRLSDAAIPAVLRVGGAMWEAWPAMLPTILSVVIVSFLAVLMNLVAIEQSAPRPIRIDRQIRAAGLGNLVGGALGGIGAYPSPTLDSLGRAFTPQPGPQALAAMTATLVVVAAGGVVFLGALPRAPLVFLLAFLGTGFLVQWLWHERRRMPAHDFLIVLLVMAVTIVFGVLPAIVAGFIAAALRFTVAYGRLGLVRSTSTVADRRSTIERPEAESHVLSRHGKAARLFELQGFLFFGSVGGLFDRVVEEIEARPDGMDILILDFARVSGLDVSALRTIARLDAQAHAAGLSVWMTGLSPATETLLRRAGLSAETTLCRHLDAALAAVEARILAEHAGETAEYAPLLSLLARARREGGDACLTERLYTAGDVLFERGDASDSLICLVSGQLVAEIGEGHPVATFMPGALVGEIGFLTGGRRTATVRAEADTRVFVVDRPGLEELRKRHPETAATLTDSIAQIVARRLARTSRRLAAVEAD